MTGVSVPDVAAKNLLWTGAGSSDWNTTPSNTNWADTDNANAAAPFVTNDNVTINTAATIAVDGGGVSPANLNVSAASGTVSLTGGDITALSLVKTGASTLTMDAVSNSFSGGVSLDGGIVSPVDAGALGSGLINMGGGTLNTPSTLTLISNNFGIGTAAGSTIDADADVEFSGTFSASGAAVEVSNQLTKTGAGTVTFSATGPAAFGAQSNVGADGTSIDFDVAAGGAVFSGSGTRNLGGTNTWDGSVSLAGGTIQFHGNTVDGAGLFSVDAPSTIDSRLNRGAVQLNKAITLNSNLTIDTPGGSNDTFFNGVISGGGNLTQVGNGTAVLTADNLYSGTTSINGGSSGGTLVIGNGGSSGSLGSGLVTVTTPGTLEFRRDNALVVGNVISGDGTVVVNNGASGSTTLSGTNDYTGITRIDSGTLVAPVIDNGYAACSIGAATPEAFNLVLRGQGTLSYTGPTASTDREFSLGGAVNGSITGGGTISVDGTGPLSFTSTNAVGGDGTGSSMRILTLAGGAPGISSLALAIGDGQNSVHSVVKSGTTTWLLTGNNTYTGDTTINNGTLQLGAATDLTDSSIVRINGTSSVLQLTDGLTDQVEELWIDGVQMAAGTWGNSAADPDPAHIDNIHFTGTGMLQVNTGPPAGDYNTWAAIYSPADLSNTAGDNDNDGLINQQEYAYGLDPVSGASVNPILVQLDKGSGTFTYQRRSTTNLTYTILTSPDLVTWTPDDDAIQDATTVGDNESVLVTLTGPLPSTKLFVRVKAD